AIVERSLAAYGVIIFVGGLDEACAIANELAPEHLELMTNDDDGVAAQIHEAGAIFFGPNTPEAVGDYLAGPNHVLPTGGAARFSSALGVYDFVKRTSLLRLAIRILGPSVCTSGWPSLVAGNLMELSRATVQTN
ncbi:MAG: histidinol dehydrogenase, partial [Pyrinomonadaceae bacterium]